MSREPTALLLAAFLITFVFTRAYTRIARVRGWGSASANGVHLHHLVVGIVFVLRSGFVEIAARPPGGGTHPPLLNLNVLAGLDGSVMAGSRARRA